MTHLIADILALWGLLLNTEANDCRRFVVFKLPVRPSICGGATNRVKGVRRGGYP